MLTIYLCFLAGGAVLPLINVLAGFFSHGIDADIDSDFDTDADIGMEKDLSFDQEVSADVDANAGTGPDISSDSMFSIGLLPSSLLSISTMAIIFGASGALMTIGDWNKILTVLISLVFGYLASVVVQTIINSLKKVQTINSGINESELLLYDGKVIDTILPGQLGTVSFVTLKDIRVSYPARCDDINTKLETGRIVKAKEYKNGIFIVEPKNKYEK